MSDASATVQSETETTRVTRWDLAPGTSTGPHVHGYDYIVVPITDGVLTITSPDGAVVDAPISLGVSYSRPAGVEHDVANDGATHIAFVEIELLEHPVAGNG